MPSRRQLSYREKAQQLRGLGFKVHFGNGKKGTTAPAYKSAVARRWNKLAPLYLTNTKQVFKFFPLDKSEKKIFKKAQLAKAQYTPGGVLLHVPKGIEAKSYKYRIGSEGEIISFAKGKRGGKVKETVYNLDPVAVATDPQKEIDAILAKPPRPFWARFVVNGNDAGPVELGQNGWRLKPFQTYAPEKVAMIMDPNLDKTGEQAKRHGAEGMDAETFCEIFQIKVIHQLKSVVSKKTRHAPKRKASRRRR